MSASLPAAPDAVIFDFDGVIIDSTEPVRSALADTIAHYGLPARAPAELDRFIGPPSAVAFSEMAGQPAESDLVAQMIKTYRGHYAAIYLERTTLVPGIAAVLAELTGPLAIATSKTIDFVSPLLERLTIEQYFDVVSGPASTTPDEPKTVTLARALDQLRRAGPAERPVIVGDRSFDIVAAHANQIMAIGVTWGVGDRHELEAAGAEVIIDHPDELAGVLEPLS